MLDLIFTTKLHVLFPVKSVWPVKIVFLDHYLSDSNSNKKILGTKFSMSTNEYVNVHQIFQMLRSFVGSKFSSCTSPAM